ncbi:MAG: GerMN domain-containing protein [Spirochaetia bacterium]|jgi:spore germination protein GerM
MARKKGSRVKAKAARHRGIGFLFWLCLAAILVAVGFAARPSLRAAFARLAGSGTPPATSPSPTAPQVTIGPLEKDRPQGTEIPSTAAEPATARDAAGAAEKPSTPPVQKPSARKARLFFVSVDPSGKLSSKSVIRSVQASDSPLRDTLETLLKGPTSLELNSGLLTMIPMEARLLGVTVRGDTAYIDFSETFRFNSQGTEALDAQLKQVVYAATEFPNVKKVQILIEGKKVRSLGAEGTRIDESLSRASFQ